MNSEEYLWMFLALAVPWFCGSMLVRVILGVNANKYTCIGHGYLIGLSVVVLQMQISRWFGVPVSLPFILMFTVVVGGGCGLFALKRGKPKAGAYTPGSVLSVSRLCLQSILILLVAIHLFLVFQELMLRPTFSWDSWRGWEPKAIQFFMNQGLIAKVHTIGNYGFLTPAISSWMMMALGETHEPMLHLPWFLALVAMCIVLYGYFHAKNMQLAGFIAVYLLASTPFLNIHVALAGYADIWLALAFMSGVLLITEMPDKNRLGHFVLVLAYLFISIITKRAGLVVAVALLASLPYSFIRPIKRNLIVLLVLSMVALVIAVLAINGTMAFEFEIPGLGRFILSDGNFVIPGMIALELGYSPVNHALRESLFVFASWHLTAYLFVLCICFCLVRRAWGEFMNPIFMAVLGVLILQYGYFSFAAPGGASDQTALSRALLYAMPIGITWMVCVVGSYLHAHKSNSEVLG